MLSHQVVTLKTDHPTPECLQDLVEAVTRLSSQDFQLLQKQVMQNRQKTGDLMDAKWTSDDKYSVDCLTSREREVLTLVASGYSRKEIGEALEISGNTAACHIASIYRKLDIRTIAEATIVAIRCKLI